MLLFLFNWDSWDHLVPWIILVVVPLGTITLFVFLRKRKGRPWTPAIRQSCRDVFLTNADHILPNWMGTYGPLIKRLPLNKLCLVETHDAGTFRMKARIVEPWTTTQHATLQQQLQAGVRVLDLRVGCCGPNQYILVHGKFWTATSLEQALRAVCEFVDRHSQEVVILDFHRFIELEGYTIDWNVLQDLVLQSIGDRLYASLGSSLPTLEEIWKTNARILVAWNSTNGTHPHFFPGIHQGWYPTATTVDELHAAIDDDLRDNTPCHKKGLWTVGAVLPAAPFRQVPHIPQLLQWFLPGKEWTKAVNIIQADFVVEMDLVPNAVAQCVLKAKEQEFTGHA